MDDRILNYQIEKILGEGGMSRVYLGIDPITCQKVAIKELLPHLAQFDDIRERFRHEAKVMALLNHPNIVRLLRYEESDNRLFLIEEYVDGINLELYINNHKGTIPEKEAIILLNIILDAFSYAHSKGIIHRDIKPSNIIIENNENIKILDFGIAKILDSGFTNFHTKTGVKIGTLIYMSPEQVKGEEASHLTDIYSLGVLLFQMLTGSAPYDLTKESEYEIQKKIVMDYLPKMKNFYPYVSDSMQLIVEKATSKKADKRYTSCVEFQDALHNESNSIILSVLLNKKSNINKILNYLNKSRYTLIVSGFIVFMSVIICIIAIFHNNVSNHNPNIHQKNKYVNPNVQYNDNKENKISNDNILFDKINNKVNNGNESNTDSVLNYRTDAENGNAEAQNKLGFVYEKGIGVKINYNEAIRWYRKSAEQGNAKAQNNLGSMYDQGIGVKKNYPEAVRWYRKSAEQGNAKAQNNLGSMYDQGTGVKQDYTAALNWYLKAAMQGNITSQYNLGLKYQHGDGIGRNYKLAYYWFAKAKIQGHKKADQHIKEIGY